MNQLDSLMWTDTWTNNQGAGISLPTNFSAHSIYLKKTVTLTVKYKQWGHTNTNYKRISVFLKAIMVVGLCSIMQLYCWPNLGSRTKSVFHNFHQKYSVRAFSLLACFFLRGKLNHGACHFPRFHFISDKKIPYSFSFNRNDNEPMKPFNLTHLKC